MVSFHHKDYSRLSHEIPYSAYVALDGAVTLSFAADTSAVDASVVASADVTTVSSLRWSLKLLVAELSLQGVEATAGPSQYTLGPFNLFHTDLTLYKYVFINGSCVRFAQIEFRQSLSFGGDAQMRLAQPAYGNLVEDGVFSPGGGLSANITSHPFESLGHPLDRRSVIGGTLTCPQTIDNSGSASCDQQLADDDPADADPDDTTDELFRRSGVLDGLLDYHSCECPSLNVLTVTYTRTVKWRSVSRS